jgi:hypothetical protein
MPSNIDPTKPNEGVAKTADVRANFAAAKAETEALQVLVGGLMARTAVLEKLAPYIPPAQGE